MLRTSDNARSHEKGESNQTDRLSAAETLRFNLADGSRLVRASLFLSLSLSLARSLIASLRVIR